MDFKTAIEILNNEIKTRDFSNLYREIPDRAANPDIWDEQTEFWKNIILKLVFQDRNLIFNVDEVSKQLMWNEIYPPLKPALVSLLRSKDFISLKTFMKGKKPLFLQIAERIICTSDADESELNEFVVIRNVKSICEKVKMNIISNANAATDFIISDEEICNMYKIKSITVISKYLTDNRYAKRLDGGFYFYNSSFSPLNKKEEDVVLALRKAIEQVNRHIKKLEGELRVTENIEERGSLERKIRNARIVKDSGLQCLNLHKEGLFSLDYIDKSYEMVKSIRNFVFTPHIEQIEIKTQQPKQPFVSQQIYPELPDVELMQPTQPVEPIKKKSWNIPMKEETHNFAVQHEMPKESATVKTVISPRLLDDDEGISPIPTRSAYGMMPRKTFFNE
jgi:hypothetical protein